VVQIASARVARYCASLSLTLATPLALAESKLAAMAARANNDAEQLVLVDSKLARLP
jgi:hypothetical protein